MALNVLDLRRAPSWEFSQLVLRSVRCLAPATYVGLTRSLGSLTVALSPSRVTETPAVNVVTPQDVDSRSGRISGTAARGGVSTYYVGAGGLQPGDVLIAAQPHIPALLIGEEHEGYAFSSRWIGLRLLADDVSPLQPLLLWALLASRAGEEARTSVAVGTISHRVSRAELLRLEVPIGLPVPRPGVLERLWRGTLVATSPVTARSWQGMANLRLNDRWSDVLRSHHAANLTFGPTIRELGATIRSGSLTRARVRKAPLEGALPVITVQALRNVSAPDAWALPLANEIVGQRGNITITTAGARVCARVLTDAALVGRGLSLVQGLQTSDADRLVRYVASTAGQDALRQLITGDYIPHLTNSALLDLVLPDAINTAVPERPEEPLADALERALWNSIAG